MKENNQMVPSEDEEICTSTDKVCSNDDLLIEILLRLPVLSLVLFKSVSKRWLSLITGHKFTLLRSKNPNVDPPSGLLLQASSVFTYVPFNTTNPVKRPPSICTFSFDVNFDDIRVLQSCNGLMLCFDPPDKYYVYNPTINLYKLLALPHDDKPDRFIKGMAIAFDPTLSPHYKVLYPLYHFTNPEIPARIGIYSSETGNWSICAQTFNSKSFWAFEKGIYWNDAIHWIAFSDEVFHFNLDTENPHFIHVESPRTLIGRAYFYDILSVTCACLLLLRSVKPKSLLQMNVYEMENDYSGWSIKYHVNLNHITDDFFNFMADEPYFFVLSILLGERDEETFLVLEVPGKYIKYSVISQTFHVLRDFQPIRQRGTSLSSFLFTPSFAGV